MITVRKPPNIQKKVRQAGSGVKKWLCFLVALHLSAPALAQWQIIPGRKTEQPLCTVILTPAESTVPITEMRIRIVSDTGTDLRFSTLGSDKDTYELVVGNIRAPLADFRVSDTRQLADLPTWQTLVSTTQFHMTQAHDRRPFKTARFEVPGFGKLLAAMATECGLLLPQADPAAQEASLKLKTDTIRLINFAVFEVTGNKRDIASVSATLSNAARDRLADALRRLGIAPSRFLDKQSLETLLATIGISIAPSLEEVTMFSNGIAGAKKGGRWGIINHAADWVLNPRFDAVASPSEGFLPLRAAGTWRLFNNKGVRVRHIRGQEAGQCNIGICRTVRNGTVFYRTAESGKQISGPWRRGTPFSETFALVEREGAWQKLFTNTTTSNVQLKAHDVRNPVNDVIVAQMTKQGAWQLVNPKNLVFYGDKFDDVIMSGKRIILAKQDKKWAPVSVSTGQFLFRPKYHSVGAFSRGLAPATLDGANWGYIRRDGVWVLKPQFKTATAFSEGIAVADFGMQKFGLIGTKGQILVPPIFDEIGPMSNGRSAFRIGDSWGFLSKDLLK